MTTASTWADAMKRARTLDPQRIAAAINQSSPSGLRAARFDAQGSRTTFVDCEDREHCHDGPERHKHIVTNDPTGNAATRDSRPDRAIDELRRLKLNADAFIRYAAVVLDWVKGERPSTWEGVVLLNAQLLPTTIQSGLDVDDDYRLPPAIAKVSRAVDEVERIAKEYMPREATLDERHWTAGLADEDCCSWHLEIHRSYRRERVGGTNVCGDCVVLAEAIGRKPPRWLLEAMIDHGDRPIAWRASLSRAMDELGVTRESA